jgi:hypothetical protein
MGSEGVVKRKWTVINFPKTEFHNSYCSVNIKMDLQEVGCGVWTGSSWLRLGQVAGTCDCGNEPSGNFLTS